MRDAVTIETPGDCLHTDSNEEVIIILKGRLADILVNIDPKIYRKYVVMWKVLKVIYVKLQEALYGLLCIALLFYLKLETDLKNNVFIINKYDPCVVKKLVKLEAMTVVCHLYDLKVLYTYLFEVTKFYQYLSTIYEKKSGYIEEIYIIV